MNREKAIDLLDNLIGMVEDNQESDYDTALKMAIQALSQEPCEKPTTEDAIKTIQELMIACTPDSKYYRVGQMAISAILENEELSKDLDEALKEIDGYERGLSQEPKSGKWIYDETLVNWRCSKCNETPKTIGYVGTADFMAEHFKFCNHCGVKMELICL